LNKVVFFPLFCFFLIVATHTVSAKAASCQIMITGGRTTVCVGQPIVLIVNAEVNQDKVSEISWYRNGEKIPEANLHFLRLNTTSADSASIQVKITDVYEAKAQCSVLVVIRPVPVLEVSRHYSFLQRIFSRSPRPTLRARTNPDYEIQWFRNDTEIPGASRDRIRITEPGRYRVRAICEAGCAGFGETIVVE